ncbi:hypothetical protein QTO34_019159 [Cnephaeus nilssonii]|uniref:Uncharacterized protein n=1 Tax=Cnephaeus nilssonii TaxID=3371016 RepID=A0AA40LQS2_CNENI|nr:hypothetical protein QTO34_019159 [Eptesicus nilssonii]
MFEMMAGRSPFDIITDNPDMNTEDYLFQGLPAPGPDPGPCGALWRLNAEGPGAPWFIRDEHLPPRGPTGWQDPAGLWEGPGGFLTAAQQTGGGGGGGGGWGTRPLTLTPFAVILEKPIRIPRFLSVKASHVLKGFLNKVRSAAPGVHHRPRHSRALGPRRVGGSRRL